MTFLNSGYIFPIIIFLGFFCYITFKSNETFFKWVEDHWFFTRSRRHKISSILYLVGIGFLLFSLLDLRGKEIKVSAKTSGQKTIILIDNSASMMVEDVRPNRFSKALFLAKHYVKRAVGQKISVLVFSDGTKKIVPFTDDISLIDARIDTLKGLNLNRGGTSLSLAVQESIQYFRDTSKDASGNILIFTDAEETDGGVELNIPDGISVGVVGIGTSKGGPIPVRNSKGIFRKNKEFQGKVVISKLDNDFLKSLGSKIRKFKYWVATSYSLPTEEILSFFSSIHIDKNKENDFRVRPVLAPWLMIPGVLFLCLSFLLKKGNVFIVSMLLLMTFSSFAQVKVPGMPELAGKIKEKEEPTKSELALALEDKLSKGELDKKGKEALAAQLLQDGFPKESFSLYDEVLDKKITNQNLPHKFNQATALLQNQGKAKAINRYNNILKYIEKNPSSEHEEMEKMAKTNILKALQSSQGNGKGEEENESDDQESSDNNDSSDGKGKDKKQKKSDDQNDGKDGKDDKKEKDKQDQSGDDKKDNQDKKKDQDGDEKKKTKSETGEEKKKRKKKLPALLKQLVDDDNNLQKKMIDAKTTERKSRDKKDW